MLSRIEDVEMLDETRILGEGSYSAVYKVRSKRDNKIYALKKAS